jgi:hypothetical protein
VEHFQDDASKMGTVGAGPPTGFCNSAFAVGVFEHDAGAAPDTAGYGCPRSLFAEL